METKGKKTQYTVYKNKSKNKKFALYDLAKSHITFSWM